MNRSKHDAEGEGEMHRQIHQIAQKIFIDEPEPIGEEINLQKLFVRILEKEDWTDKLASGLGKIRNKIIRPRGDAKSSKEARTRPIGLMNAQDSQKNLESRAIDLTGIRTSPRNFDCSFQT